MAQPADPGSGYPRPPAAGYRPCTPRPALGDCLAVCRHALAGHPPGKVIVGGPGCRTSGDQLRHRPGGDETRPQQDVLVQLGDLLALRQIRLAARDIPHVRRVARAHLDPGADQRVIDRPPVHPPTGEIRAKARRGGAPARPGHVRQVSPRPGHDRAHPVASARRRQVAWAGVTTEWTAPAVGRADPDCVAAEREALEQWLDYHRATLLTKCAGLTAEQLKRRAVAPSNLSLLGLVRHMADTERGWFRQCAAREDVPDLYWAEADHDADFNGLEVADAEADLDTYRREVVAARKAVAGKGLDEVVSHPQVRAERDIRWIYLHMIEEYARHNGHADLIRECIDGVTGD